MCRRARWRSASIIGLFQHDREKDLDLVICRRSQPRTQSGLGSFAEMVEASEIVLGEEEHRVLMDLPEVPLTGVQTALVALEAKAAFTEFGKARPRLYDELNSSHLTIHGDTDQAIAVGLAMINAAGSFVSPLRNPWSLGQNPTVVNKPGSRRTPTVRSPRWRQLPRRPAPGQRGFDAVGVVMLECANDGSPVQVMSEDPPRQPGDAFYYDALIGRVDTIMRPVFGPCSTRLIRSAISSAKAGFKFEAQHPVQ